MQLDVVYLDNHLLVLAKPPGVLVQADRTGDPDLLTVGKSFLKDRFQKPGNVFLGLVHRLDRPASGLVVFARTTKAAARLSDQFRRRIPQKRYLAIVEGILRGASTLVHHVAKRGGRVEVVDSRASDAMHAELDFVARAHEDDLTLLDIRLTTGRPHQIRVQCASTGHPLLGDLRYGALRRLESGNLALHAYSLGLWHPTSGEWMNWHLPPPESWGARFREAIELTMTLEAVGGEED